MKKIVLFCLVLFLVLGLVACGGGRESTREAILSTTMEEFAFGGLELRFSEDISHITFDGRLILTFSEETEPSTGAVLNTPNTAIDFSRDFFEDVTDRMDRVKQGDVEEISVNGGTAYLQHFEDHFVFVMFEGNSGVYGINFSSSEEGFDRYFPYFMDILESIEDGDNNLVGTWIRNDDPSHVFTFNADETGLFDIGIATLPFTWTVDGGTFLMIGEGVRDELSFFIDRDVLTTIAGNGDTRQYTRSSDIGISALPAEIDEPEEIEADEPEELEEEPEEAPAADAQTLAGSWAWMGSVYYVFEAGGGGTMLGEDIRWTTSRGILSICTTPGLCGSSCVAPMEWYYELNGNNLNLTSTIFPEMSYDYTRR